MLPPEIPTYTKDSYVDRKGGLVAFGIMTMLMGAILALFAPLMIWGASMAKNVPGQDTRAIFSSAVIYAVMGATFICLGIGSMKAQRWARALLLIFAWGWLIVGICTMVFLAVCLPQMMGSIGTSVPSGTPPPPTGAIVGITMVFTSIFMVIIPGVWVLFYQSRNVKVTCEVENPEESWTDRCPLPVIAICAWMASAVPSMVLMSLGYKGAIPFFGTFLVGAAGTVAYLVIAAAWSYSAWAMYHLRWSGWWVLVVSLILFSVSAFITYTRHDVSELYELMGYPAEQIAQMKKFTFMKGQTMAWLSGGGALLPLAYLLFVRKYFVAAEARR
jgi:hypothetical protein